MRRNEEVKRQRSESKEAEQAIEYQRQIEVIELRNKNQILKSINDTKRLQCVELAELDRVIKAYKLRESLKRLHDKQKHQAQIESHQRRKQVIKIREELINSRENISMSTERLQNRRALDELRVKQLEYHIQLKRLQHSKRKVEKLRNRESVLFGIRSQQPTTGKQSL